MQTLEHQVNRNVSWRGGGNSSFNHSNNFNNTTSTTTTNNNNNTNNTNNNKMKSVSIHPVLKRTLTNNSLGTPRKGTSDGGVPVNGACIGLCIHIIACIVCLVLGYRFSREALLVLVIRQPEVSLLNSPPRLDLASSSLAETDVGLKFPYVPGGGGGGGGATTKGESTETKSSRVHVGRHEILIRPWPHPDKTEVYKAHALLERVQTEQRNMYGPRNWRTVIAITPTFARTFQAIHLLGVMHTLRAVPGEVIWIVVEAGGASNETASLLADSQLNFVHLGVEGRMPFSWEQRRRMETRLRVEGLRHVRRERLDGLVVFADDSNVHSLQLFDELQKVSWIGALSVGVLEGGSTSPDNEKHVSSRRLPIQGPACNDTCNVIGWHALRTPVDGDDNSLTGDVARHLEWSGFVINSRAVWEDEEKPEWINEWDVWLGEESGSTSPLQLVSDQGGIEPLGNCGREVLLWWARTEARADSRYPSRWTLKSPLEVTVPAKRTPWPEYVEQLNESESGRVGSRKLDPAEKRSKRTGGRRGKRRQQDTNTLQKVEVQQLRQHQQST